MNIFQYTIKSPAKILAEFKVDPKNGLTNAEAANRFSQYGKNEVSGQTVHWWDIFLRQFKSPFIYLLFGAAFLAFVLQEILNGLMILLFLAINAGLGFYQEYRSEKTAQLLKKYVVSYAKVIRQGKERAIPAAEVVTGDLMILETGDKIPADLRLLETHDLTIDESILTGESAAVKKTDHVLPKVAREYYQAVNLAFSGTTVLNGFARGIVLATGRQSAIGQIAHLTLETRHVSSFTRGIARFSTFILRLVLVTLTLVFLVNIFIKKDGVHWVQLALFAIALAVSVIPEALPLVTTFSLSRGARRLAQKKVIVKRLSAIEDLGGIEILCTDKTGTLTKNVLAVAQIKANSSSEILTYANLASPFSKGRKVEPFDLALSKRLTSQHKKDFIKINRILEIPFNPKLRRNGVLIKQGRELELITRGAPEEILKLCSSLSSEHKKDLLNWVSQEGSLGRRVLAVAKKKLVITVEKAMRADLERENKSFNWLGMVSFTDQIKPTTHEAVQQAVELGVKIKIITGDSPEVAGAVASEIGLIKSPDEVINVSGWQKLSVMEQEKTIEDYAVFARVSPEQKYSIIRILQKKYEVGFLGEGINDAPALKAAGVSLVVDSAADIAREAADIILLQKSLKVILDGIKEGREVFANTTKYIKATLASNFGNFFAVAIASFLIDFLPMLPLQILLVNLLSDAPMIGISTDNVDQIELVRPKKYNVRSMILLAILLGIVSMVFDFIFFGLFYRLSPAVLQTNWFIGSILTELVLIFSIRSRKLFFRAKKSSVMLLILSCLAFLATIILPFTAFGQRVFHFIRPSLSHLYLIIFIVAIYFVCTEIVKLLYYRSLNHSKG